jgi:hypothetical protein
LPGPARAYFESACFVFAGIWAPFQGTTDLIKAFQIRRVAKALEGAV